MAVVKTTTGSNWQIWEGVAEDIVNGLMTSGAGTGDLQGWNGPSSVGSYAVLLNTNGLPR